MCTHLILNASIIIKNKYSSGRLRSYVVSLAGLWCVASDLNEIVLTLHLLGALFHCHLACRYLDHS